MKAFRICLALIYFFSDFLCVNAQVNYRAVELVAHLKSVVTRLDSAGLAGEANVGAVRKVLDRRFQVLGIGEQSHGTSEFLQPA